MANIKKNLYGYNKLKKKKLHKVSFEEEYNFYVKFQLIR